MKKTLIIGILFVCLNSNAQLSKPDFQQVGYSIELGGSILFSMMPSRMNTMEYSGGYLKSETFETYNSVAFGLKGDITLSPINHDNFAYFFKTSGMYGWLSSHGQSSLYMGHQFRIGAPRIKFVCEFGKYKYRRATYYSFTTISRTSGTEKVARSYYDGINKIKLGASFTFRKEQNLLVLYTAEKFDPILTREKAKGVFVEYTMANKVSFFTDVTFGHPIIGRYLLTTPNLVYGLEKQRISFQVGVRKHILHSKKYVELMYRDFD